MAAPVTFPSTGGFGTVTFGGGPAPKKGGLFHALDTFGGELVHAGLGVFSQGIPTIVRTAGQELSGQGIYNVLRGHPGNDPIIKNLIAPAVVSEKQYWSHPIRNIEQGHWLTPIIDAATLVSLGGGRIAAVALTPKVAEVSEVGALSPRFKAALTNRYGGPARTITARISPADLMPETVRVIPRQGYRAIKAIATDKAIRSVVSPEGRVAGRLVVGGRFGEFARGARALTRRERNEALRIESDPAVIGWKRAVSKLNAPQRVAFSTIARVPLHEDLQGWRQILSESPLPSAKQMLHVIDQPEVRKEFDNPSPKLQNALQAWHGISDLRQQLLMERGAITPEDILLGQTRHTMLARGAGVVTNDAAYKEWRKVRAAITAASRQMKSIAYSAKTVGKQDINAAIKAGRVASSAAMRGSRRREILRTGLEAAGASSDELRAQVDAARAELTNTMGNELSTSQLGGAIPEQGSSITGVGAAMTESHIRSQLEDVQARIGRLDPRTAQPNWNAAHDAEINRLKEKRASLNPKSQAPWRDRLSNQISTLNNERRRLHLDASNRKALEERQAKLQKDLEDLRGSTLVDQPFSDLHPQALGATFDRYQGLVDRYEKALTAEHGLQRETHIAASNAARQSGARQAVALARENRITALAGQEAALRHLVGHKLALERLAEETRAKAGRLIGERTPEEVLAELKASGRPVPAYVHDVEAKDRREFSDLQQMRMSPPRPGADVYGTTGELFKSGLIDMLGDGVTPAFYRALGHYTHSRLHEIGLARGVPVHGDHIPPGYEWLRSYRGQRAPRAFTATAEHVKQQRQLDGLSKEDFQDLTIKPSEHVNPEDIATDASGARIAIPKALADQFRAEFDSGTTLGNRMVRRATNVWRNLLLRVRVNWLENNVVGNTALAAIRFAGLDGLKAYLGLVMNLRGPREVARLLNMDVTRHTLSPEDFRQLAPEQLRGTRVETQYPKVFAGSLGKPGSRLEKATFRASRYGTKALDLLPGADRWYEQHLRKGGFETTLRQQPEVRAIYRAQPKGEKSWRDAMVQGVEQHPHLQQLASREVNDALGDFLSLSRTERNQVRQLVPFYAWLREATRITAKLVIDTPERAKVLQLLAQAAGPEQVPTYLEGGIPLGGPQGGLQTILKTQGMNPLSTPIGVGRLAVALASRPQAGVARILSGNLSPFASPLLNPEQGNNLFGWTPPLILQPLASAISNLPEYRAIAPVTNRKNPPLYPGQGLLERLSQAMLGNQIATYSVNEAARRARLGQ